MVDGFVNALSKYRRGDKESGNYVRCARLNGGALFSLSEIELPVDIFI